MSKDTFSWVMISIYLSRQIPFVNTTMRFTRRSLISFFKNVQSADEWWALRLSALLKCVFRLRR